MILGTDAARASTRTATRSCVHAVIGDPPAGGGDETSTRGARCSPSATRARLAEQVAVPRRNLVPKPEELSFEEAACLPTAWLTAYRMLFTRGAAEPGGDGAGPGRRGRRRHRGASRWARALGRTVFGHRRSEDASAPGRLGADAALETRRAAAGERVDAVLETVGEATWSHSLKSLRPGGTIVVCGATSGQNPPRRAQPRLLPAAVGRRLHDGHDARSSAALFSVLPSGLRPAIDPVLPLADAARRDREGRRRRRARQGRARAARLDLGEQAGHLIFCSIASMS